MNDHPADALRLPANLGLDQAAPLRESLLQRRGRPLEIDAGEVERLSGPCFQVRVSARKTWTADGQPLHIAVSSPAFENALALLGAPGLEPTHEKDVVA